MARLHSHVLINVLLADMRRDLAVMNDGFTLGAPLVLLLLILFYVLAAATALPLPTPCRRSSLPPPFPSPLSAVSPTPSTTSHSHTTATDPRVSSSADTGSGGEDTRMRSKYYWEHGCNRRRLDLNELSEQAADDANTFSDSSSRPPERY